jgi:hypothetical protein
MLAAQRPCASTDVNRRTDVNRCTKARATAIEKSAAVWAVRRRAFCVFQSSSGANASIGIFLSPPILIVGTNDSSTTTKIAIVKSEINVRCSD